MQKPSSMRNRVTTTTNTSRPALTTWAPSPGRCCKLNPKLLVPSPLLLVHLCPAISQPWLRIHPSVVLPAPNPGVCGSRSPPTAGRFIGAWCLPASHQEPTASVESLSRGFLLNRSSGKGKKQPSLHYTAAQLLEKGVLVEIEDLPVSQYVSLENVRLFLSPERDKAGMKL